MKTRLLILNWAFSWIPLSYCGTDPLIALLVVGWFIYSSKLLINRKVEVDKAFKNLDKRIDKFINQKSYK